MKVEEPKQIIKQGAETIDYVQTTLTLLFSLAQSVLSLGGGGRKIIWKHGRWILKLSVILSFLALFNLLLLASSVFLLIAHKGSF